MSFAYSRIIALIVCASIALLFVLVFTNLDKSVIYGVPQYTLNEGGFSDTDVSARSWMVFDAVTGEVIASSYPDMIHPIASVTKLITAETFLADFDTNASTTVSWRAVVTEGRSGRLSAGEQVKTYELLFPLLIESSNDAAEAIAESVNRDTFVKTMNDRARSLEMTQSSFVDPSGLSDGNRASAHDLKLLLMDIREQHPHILDITRLSNYIGRKHTWYNNNPVFSDEGYIGGKHGYTEAADRTFAGIFEEHFESELSRPIGFVLLGSNDLERDISLLRTELHEKLSYDYRF